MGIDRLNRRLNAIPIAVRNAVKPSLEQSGTELRDAMRALAEPHRDSGDLINSIVMTPGGQASPPYSQPGGSMVVPENAVVVSAGDSQTRYPHLLEYGHHNGFNGSEVPAYPFFWPAFRLLRRRITNRTKRAISKAVREGWSQS